LKSNQLQSSGTADKKSTNREGNGPLEQACTCLDVGERFHELEIRQSKFRSDCPAGNFRMARHSHRIERIPVSWRFALDFTSRSRLTKIRRRQPSRSVRPAR
jgi:hypothetical protein